MSKAVKHHYTPTEAKYKGGAQEMHVTYDLPQETRGGPAPSDSAKATS